MVSRMSMPTAFSSMPLVKKRKISETTGRLNDTPRDISTAPTSLDDAGGEECADSAGNTCNDNDSPSTDPAANDHEARRERFRALQVRAVSWPLQVQIASLITRRLGSGTTEDYSHTDATI